MSRPSSLVQLGDPKNELRTTNLMLYGHPGEGKTPFWGTGGDTVLILDSDHGTESAEAAGSRSFYMPVVDYDDLHQAYEFCKNDIKKELPSVKWVVWDSLTLFQDRALIDDIMPDAHAQQPKQEEFVPSRREYLMNMHRISRYVRLFVELPINFGISCHVMNGSDEEGKPLWVPAVQGKGMSSKITGYMNVVGFMGKVNVKDGDKNKRVNRILFNRVGRYYARDRFHALGNYMDNPTLPRVDQAIQKKRQSLIEASKTSPATPARRRRTTQGR